MSQYRNFHPGEAQLQAESGVDTAEFDIGVEQAFRPELNQSEVKFAEERTFSVAASIDSEGRPWASPLVGRPGELFTVEDPTTVRVRPRRISGDPLFDNVTATEEMGILYFNPSIRRRAKSLGKGVVERDGSITYHMHRMFGLCPKYIFKRVHDPDGSTEATDGQPGFQRRLAIADRADLAAADTIFLASHSAHHGTDPTHRGGPPGFVTILDDTTLSIPDYVGNGMFQTLGNILLDDRIGLLSIDFATGRTLQLTGHGSIQPSDPDDAYSDRTLIINIDEVRVTWPHIGAWTDVEAFDMRPNLINPATPYRVATES